MTYCLRSQNSNYFVRYKDGIPYIYYTEFQPNPPSDECGINLRFLCYDFYDTNTYYNLNWNPDTCDNGYTHITQIPVNSYLYPQLRNPPVGSYNLLCGNNYDIRISDKIKISIPDDPIFSGTYVFDYVPGGGDSDLFSSNWILNSVESNHNLSSYNHPDSAANGKLLVSLCNSDFSASVFGYPGYMEIKTSYYNDDNNAAARQLEDVFAFPAEFIFTAVQPPCPCTGIPDVDYIGTSGIGHRVTVALAAPIRWRHPYRDWILVDKVSHTIDNSIINYATGTLFNDGALYVNRDIYLLNSKYIKYTKSYVPGTANTVIGDGYISIAPNDYDGLTSIVCTGIPDLGIAFRSSAYGLGIDRGQTYYFDSTANIQGIGGFQEFTRNVVDNWDFIIKDERPFFDSKIPIKANVEFIYSCRPGLPCFNITPSIISPVTGTGIGCIVDYYTSINIDYLCGEYDGKPDDAYWINNNITSTNIIYSGISGLLPTLYKYGGGGWTDNIVYEAYITNDENPVISIPYTGYSKPSSVRDWINRELRLVYFGQDANGNLDINNISSTNPVVDLHWNIVGNSATAYIVPSDEDAYTSIAPQLMLINAGTSDVNGKYIWDKYSNQFYQQPNNGFSIRLSYDLNDTINNYNYGWRVGRFDINTNGWVPYYKVSGFINLIDRTNSSYINSNWIIPNNCYSGLYPPPNSITDPSGDHKYIYVSEAESVLNGYYYLNAQTGFWTSIQNPNAQIRLIDSNYFIGIVSNNIYNIYYMLYNGYAQFLGSELIYYGNKIGNTLSLNIDAHPNCILDISPPETITIKPCSIGTGLATLRFWRNIYSTCNSVDGTGVANQTINISCASGSIGVNNDTLNAGSSKIYNTIPFDSANGTVTTSNAGINNLIFIQGLTTDAAFSGNAILNWNNNRDHDLYGQLTLSSYIGQINSSSPVGVWISNGRYLGNANPSSKMEIF